MKLLTKTNRYYLLSSILVFLVGGIIFYAFLQAIIREEVSDVLDFELQQKIEELNQQTGPPTEVSGVEFSMTRVAQWGDDRVYQDTLLWDEGEAEFLPYRQLTLYHMIQGEPYRLTLRESLIESEGILFAVSVSLATLFGLMILTLWLVNYLQARRLWAGFYENIHHLRNYDVVKGAHVPRIHSDIDEFQEMNAAIINMTDKIRDDYGHLKEFTENASHEMQTPLAIVRSNLDLLTQSELREEQHTFITRISQAVRRMTSTHRALLLLSKIENQQFKEQARVDFYALVAERLEEFADFMEAKQLQAKVEGTTKTLVFAMNPQLADILISNLLTNAIKHNIPAGFLDIHITATTLRMTNSGLPLRSDPVKLFQRFSKDNPATDSAGLGMAIIKVICDSYFIKSTYEHHDDMHEVILAFPMDHTKSNTSVSTIPPRVK